MLFPVIFRPEARDEAADAAAYIAEHAGVEIAPRWYADLEVAIESLSTMPKRCPFARENAAFPDDELRQILVHSHRLIFTIRHRTVHILHVRHGLGMKHRRSDS